MEERWHKRGEQKVEREERRAVRRSQQGRRERAERAVGKETEKREHNTTLV